MPRKVCRIGVAALPLLAIPFAPAFAQAYQCRMGDARISVAPITPDGPVRRTPVTGYTLALSWSPEYCRTRGSDAAESLQCSGRNGRFGFVVHGLWPEGAAGRWPQWCRTAPAPSPAAIRPQLCMMPSPRLMAHEWARHGTCMARSPDAYFRVTRILWDSLQWPDLDRLSREKALNAGRIRQAFVDANPGWRTDQVGVSLNGRGWLREIRLCYGKDFRPARCHSGQFGPRDAVRARIWRGL